MAHHVATNISLNERCILVSERLDQVKNVVLVVRVPPSLLYSSSCLISSQSNLLKQFSEDVSLSIGLYLNGCCLFFLD